MTDLARAVLDIITKEVMVSTFESGGSYYLSFGLGGIRKISKEERDAVEEYLNEKK